VVVGGIYSPNHQSGRWEGLLSYGAPDSPVHHRTHSGAPPDTLRCASHVTQPLGFDRWSSDLWGHRTVRWCTGQVLFTVWCAFCACSDFCVRSPRTVAHCSPFADDRWRASRCLRWHTGQSSVTPDSLVNYSGVAPQIPEAEQFRVDPP
jgi:hypothetical protein